MPDHNFFQGPFLQSQGKDLKQEEEQGNGQKREGNFFYIFRKSIPEADPQISGILDFWYNSSGIGALGSPENKTQNENCQYRTYRTEGYQSKTVVFCMLIASDGRETNTQSHDKWNGHGAGRHAAGIKGDSKKISGNKGSQVNTNR